MIIICAGIGTDSDRHHRYQDRGSDDSCARGDLISYEKRGCGLCNMDLLVPIMNGDLQSHNSPKSLLPSVVVPVDVHDRNNHKLSMIKKRCNFLLLAVLGKQVVSEVLDLMSGLDRDN